MTPSEISAELCTFVPGRRVDDHMQVQIRYANGARGLFCASQVACGEENELRLRLYGSRASLRWEHGSPNELWFHELGQSARRLTRGMAGLSDVAAAATRIPAGHPEGFIEAFAQLYRDFAADVRLHQRGDAVTLSVPGLHDGLRSLSFIEAVLASQNLNGAWVKAGLD
jgi:predicted dehydrogenase